MRPVLASAARIGRYTLIRKLGDGAFGTVWAARDTELDCDVAIKIFCRGNLNESQLSHVLREARTTGQLDHPNIVRVFDTGSHGEYRYIVSELIDGVGLDAWLKRYRCDARQAARWCATIAGALQHAHDAGVIHRDLKPANIMIDQAGTVHIMDFGLAKQEGDAITSDIERYQLAAYRLRQDEGSKAPGGPVLGTPAYMSPEQAEGEGYFVDHRSDIYSLGVIFYELLAGKRPFRGSSDRILKLIRRCRPLPPRWINRRVPRVLEAVCLKAMARKPAARFASAQELADECERFLAGQPTRTRPRPRLWLAARWLAARVLVPFRRG